jgi:transcriptional regulator with PAS, ATPase and Fis domain
LRFTPANRFTENCCTGKELIARTIHQLSDRRDKPLVPVNCGAIPDNLFESEFFGHKKGAFTGANCDKPGFFDLGNGGILFLDEVGELSTNMQVKLLRAIEGNGYTPVGGASVIQSDVFVIAATNRNLSELINQGSMRTDFFYRINIIPIRVPPLRDRKEDIPLLIEHFLETHKSENKIASIPEKVLEALYNHDWPGNVRELQNVLQRYLAMNRIDFMVSSDVNTSETSSLSSGGAQENDMELRTAVETFEKQYLKNALDRNHWHRGNTAGQLNIPSRTLYRKMKKYRLI